MRLFAPTLTGLSFIMELQHFFTEQRVLIVAGKGGVGKSAIAGALASLSAQSGLRTLLVHLDESSIEIPTNDLLEEVLVSPGRALTDFLSSKGMGLLSRQLSRSGIVELIATTAPGLDDLLVLGRIKAFERELRADVIIVDGPAAGHALDLVRAPVQLRQAIASGPISSQADEVLDMLSDARRCKVMLVTTPAITPVSETAEAAENIMESVHIHLTPIVVNKCGENVPLIDINTLSTEMHDAYNYALKRQSAQQEAMHVLTDSLDLKQIHVQLQRLSGRPLIDAICKNLSHAIAEMP